MAQLVDRGMTSAEALGLIRRYYDACSAGDVEGLLETVHEDVTHWFLAPNPGSRPVAGAQHLARYWRKVQARIDGRWIVDAIVADGDEAVIEWTLYWTAPGSGERLATRGAEWYRFEGRRIREIRAYYQQREISTELEGFDYAGRGYSTLAGEASDLHPSGAARSA
jgi:ketosteroid isomerase-like protein